MGIKFDVLSKEFLIAETSTFSRFFTTRAPIDAIHKILKVGHDTDLTMSPTTNRHIMWEAIRDGKGLFVVINKPKELEVARDDLEHAISKLEPIAGLGRTHNEIVGFLNTLLEQGTDMTSKQYNIVKQKAIGKTGDKMNMLRKIKEIYPQGKNRPLVKSLREYLKAIRPGKYILVKRVAESGVSDEYVSRGEYLKPSERSFPVRNPVVKTGKKFGQVYNIATFDDNGVIDTESIARNAIGVYDMFFKGRGSRDFYIIEDENFKQRMKHPLKDDVHEFKIDVSGEAIDRYVKDTFAKYQKRIQTKLDEFSSTLKQRVSKSLDDPNLSTDDAVGMMRDYREALSLLSAGLSRVDTVTAFCDFVSNHINDLNYKIVNASTPGGQEYLEADALKLYNLMNNPMDLSKQTRTFLGLAFNNEGDYNDFSRKFMSYTISQNVKMPEMRDLDDLLDNF